MVNEGGRLWASVVGNQLRCSVGHVRGAFTGAVSAGKGLFEGANGGT
jgi:transcriptional regulator with GAF, ATPase, and Fis domain